MKLSYFLFICCFLNFAFQGKTQQATDKTGSGKNSSPSWNSAGLLNTYQPSFAEPGAVKYIDLDGDGDPD